MKKIQEFKDIFKKNNWYYMKSKHKDLISDYELGLLVDQGNIIKMKAGVYRWLSPSTTIPQLKAERYYRTYSVCLGTSPRHHSAGRSRARLGS